jgi:hypothetical protein
MAKAVKRKGTAPPRAGNKRVAVKSRKPSRKNETGEVTSAAPNEASGQDLSDVSMLEPRVLADIASPDVLDRLWDNHRQSERRRSRCEPFRATPCEGHSPGGSETRRGTRRMPDRSDGGKPCRPRRRERRRALSPPHCLGECRNPSGGSLGGAHAAGAGQPFTI